jgi:hypothetical protein
MTLRVWTFGLLGGLLLLASAYAADPAFADAAPYCLAIGNADAPDARYTGPKVPDWMVAALYSKDELKAQKKAKLDPARAVCGAAWAAESLPACRATARSAARPTRR